MDKNELKSPQTSNEKKISTEVKSSALGPKYLDWWIGHEKPPSYKNLADNLRAWLTIGAYIVLLNYLWHWGDDRIPGWVFQVTAVVWGVWVFWFFILTFIQMWHLYLGFCFELMSLFLEPYARRRKAGSEPTEREWWVLQLAFLPIACSSLVLVGTVFYVIGAMLRGAKLI